MRWALRIQDFQFAVSHIASTQNAVALSRAPTDPPQVDELEEHMLVPTNSTFLALLQAPVSPLLTLPAIRSAKDADPEVQALLTDLPESFSLSDGILYKNGKNAARLPFIPMAMRQSVLHFFHDSPLAGHFGYRKTIARLLRRSVLPQGPWDMLAMNLMGPLPRSANRNTYLLVVVDHFCKWVELFALKDATAPLIARTLEREIFCRFGAPASILSDNATNFRGKILANLMKAWGIEQKFTTTYHPQGNITERVNRNLRAMLSAYTHSTHSKWDEFLPETALALRTAVHSSTGFSPALLNLGREPKLPLDYAVNPVHSAGFDSRIDYSTKLIDRLASLYSQAKLNIEKSCEEQKRHYDKRHKNIVFKTNDLVLLKTHHLSKKNEKFSKKLAIRIYVMSPPVYEQQPGEHIEMFAWRVESAMRLASPDGNVPDIRIFNRVFLGLHPSIAAVIPIKPTNLEQLFSYGEILDTLLSPDDPYYRTMRQHSPVTVTVDNEQYRPPSPTAVQCYRFHEMGHYAAACTKKRINKPKRKRGCKRLKSTPASPQGRGHVGPKAYTTRIPSRRLN
ncbi:Transposon Ty3-G Gag-Pol polyprotein [Folsomia candida]|uniref:RNA-directed DNA polymerase n=1 Tax=Folsomia candida TaxID=158441 RepID=A0A226D0G8_FOLCA|nr:Transposon Ty3-G Gag-Pol polyprotein [Folsomia candida]